MVRQGIPETMPKNCGMAESLGVLSDIIVTCSSSSYHSPLELLHLFVLSLGSCDAGLHGKAAERGGQGAMAWESRAKVTLDPVERVDIIGQVLLLSGED